MTNYTHKLNYRTYQPVKPTEAGVQFRVLETGELLEMTVNQITYLLKPEV